MADPATDSAARDSRRLRLVHREIVLLVCLVAVAVGAFLVTRAFAAANDRMRRGDAAAWYGIGQRNLADGHPAQALTALRRAVSKDPGNMHDELALAATLAATDQDDAARQVLVGLRDRAPEDAGINTELARLEARAGNFSAARRYYQSALNAVWDVSQADVRRGLRLELIHLLLEHDEKGRALPEILLLSTNLPEEAAAHVEAGRLFLESGDPRHALERFEYALTLDPRAGSAVAGAGESAFALGDYTRTKRYLAAAPRSADRVAPLRALADLVLANDPMAPRLSAEERSRRLLVDARQAGRRVAACLATLSADSPGRAALERLQQDAASLEPARTLRAVREQSDAIESGLELIDRMEQQTPQECAPLEIGDRALLLIARAHGLNPQ